MLLGSVFCSSGSTILLYRSLMHNSWRHIRNSTLIISMPTTPVTYMFVYLQREKIYLNSTDDDALFRILLLWRCQTKKLCILNSHSCVFPFDHVTYISSLFSLIVSWQTLVEWTRNSHISLVLMWEVSWLLVPLFRHLCLSLCLHLWCSADSWHFLFRPHGI